MSLIWKNQQSNTIIHNGRFVEEMRKGDELVWSPKLPAHLIELPWIENKTPSNAFFNTGAILHPKSTMEVRIAGVIGTLLGARSGWLRKEWSLYHDSVNALRLNKGDVTFYIRTQSEIEVVKVNADYIELGGYKGEREYKRLEGYTNTVTNRELHLFQFNSVASGYRCTGRFYYLKIWGEDGRLEHWYKPFVHITDRTKIGIYDVVERREIYQDPRGEGQLIAPTPLFTLNMNKVSVKDSVTTTKHTQAVGMYVATGEERWQWTGRGEGHTKSDVFFCEGLIKSKNANFLSNMDYWPYRTPGATYELKFFPFSSRCQLGARPEFRDPRWNSAKEWKDHLKEQYAKGEPLVIFYPLEESVVTEGAFDPDYYFYYDLNHHYLR